MAIKMRVLYASNKGKMATIANLISNEFQLEINKVDVIPPAYSCDNERLVILGLSIKDDPSESLRLFCRELTLQRAKNVALIIDGKEIGAANIKKILKEAGTNVLDEVLYIKGGIPFLKNISEDEKKAVLAWSHRIVDQVTAK